MSSIFVSASRNIVEPHGTSLWHRQVRFEWGDIPPTRSLKQTNWAESRRSRPDGGEEPHGTSLWHRQVRFEWGDIPPTQSALHCRVAHILRPWRNDGVD